MTNILTPKFGTKTSKVTESKKSIRVHDLPPKIVVSAPAFRSPNAIYFPAINAYLRPNTPL